MRVHVRYDTLCYGAESKHPEITEENEDETEIGARPERSARKYLRRLAQETGVSKTSSRTAKVFTKLKTYNCSHPADNA
jgi:hypothetical protein